MDPKELAKAQAKIRQTEDIWSTIKLIGVILGVLYFIGVMSYAN